jgi:uncharacterized protein (TIGR03437 family)
VVDAASFSQPLVRGSWGTVFGSNLSSITRSWAGADFAGSAMPTSLNGTRVLVNGVLAPVSYISPTQVNFQVPIGAKLGTGFVQVVTTAGSSIPMATQIQDVGPGFFYRSASGQNWVLAQHADGSLIGPAPATAAHPGETIVLWGSGLGPTLPPVASGQTLPAPAPLADFGGFTISIGGQSAPVSYAGMTVAGAYQINVAVPSLPDGDYAIAANASGRTLQGTVSIPVRQ